MRVSLSLSLQLSWDASRSTRGTEHGYCIWWQKVPYSLGAYAIRPDAEGMAQLSKADGRIYFGSAAVSSSPSWLRGAVSSAWRTVESLHERVSQE